MPQIPSCLTFLPLFAVLGMATVSAIPLAPPSKPAPQDTKLFTPLAPEATGLTQVNRMNIDHPLSYLYHSGITTGGVAIADFDGDGKPDLFFAGTTGPNQLCLQRGDLRFEDVTAAAAEGLPGGDRWAAGAAVADVNGDGRLDLYLCHYMSPNQLWINLGPGKKGEPVTFRECAKEAGLDLVDSSHSASFADYDGDGKLDLYVLTNRIEDPDGSRRDMPIDKASMKEGGLPDLLPGFEKYYRVYRWDYNTWGTEAIGTPDHLYRQVSLNAEGTPTFTDTSAKAGISGRGDGLSVTWWDPDGDGDPDLYIGNDFVAGDCWYRNNGDGTFTNTISQSVPHTPWFSMGADFGDINNDGRLDLLVADMSATSHFKSKTTMGVMGGSSLKRSFYDTPPQLMRNALYVNTGTDRFIEAAYTWKVSSTDWTWSVKFADFDLDGWQDIYFTNGISRHMNDSDYKLTEEQLVGKHMFDYFKSGEMRKEVNRSYQNQHGEKFTETSEDWGLAHLGVSYGAAYGDLDRDGDLDLVVVNLEEPNSVYRNNAAGGHRLAVQLKGTKSNTHGFGAMITVATSHGKQIRYVLPVSGYLSCNEAVAHFALGEDTEASVTVRWPFGGEQTMPKVRAGEWLTVQEAAATVNPAAAPVVPLFTRHEPLSTARHKDTGWEADFAKPRQSLLPWALSQLGPCVATADVDGDGDTDLFTGAAAGEISELRLNQGAGKFSLQYIPDFAKDKACEDQGAVFFDVEGDGDVDLFVVSGSNEFFPSEDTTRALGDRLYLNDGKGKFTRSEPGAVPSDARVGSCVVAADFDGDGDSDLFIGTRVKLGEYPVSEPSRFLRNDSTPGHALFTERPDSLPASARSAMVTGACAADVTGDARADLLIATEWGPILCYQQEKGAFIDITAKAGLAETTGFWNSITPADLDHDGDLDLIVGNIGLNTKYKTPDATHPHLAYYGDFDGKGAQLVEVKREGETLYPERGKSCSTRAMPFLGEKFTTFKGFAQASLQDIYSGSKLESATKLSINEFQSGVWTNDQGHFTFSPLPRLAQVAPSFGLAAADFDADGHTDLFVNQNFLWGPQIETGPFDGGVGLFLRGDGAGKFTPVEPPQSGLIIPRDNRACAVVDLDGNGSPDLLGGQNNGPLQAFTSQTGHWLAVPVPTGTAATVTLTREGAAPQTIAISPGSGYWSQNESVARFGLGSATSAKGGKITVSANGKRTERTVE
jgi:enediyne biosynthesis protein E4